MSCGRKSRLCVDNARLNGIPGHLNRSLNAISSWSTVNALLFGPKAAGSGWGDRLANTALGTLGLGLQVERLSKADLAAEAAAKKAGNGPPPADDETLVTRRRLSLTNPAALILAAHSLEYATATTATLIARRKLRGRPYGQYHGVVLRQDPTLKNGQTGFYFHARGATWQARAAERPCQDTTKTMACLKSLSFPNRAYYFDRKLDERDAVDVALRRRDPDSLPGFLGETNEIDSLAPPLGWLKKGLIRLNWLAMDDSERDAGEVNLVDYGTLNTLNTKGFDRREAETGSATMARLTRELARQAAAAAPAPTDPVKPLKVVRTFKYSQLVQEGGGRPLAPDAWPVPEEGGMRPLRVEAVDQLADTRILAEAYYQNLDGHWCPILNENVQEQIAAAVINNYLKRNRQE